MRTKSCIMNLWRALVGWVMYTFPLPFLKFVYSGVRLSHEDICLRRTFSMMYVRAAAWSRWKLPNCKNR